MVLENGEREAAEAFLSTFTPAVALQGKDCYAGVRLGSAWLVRDGARAPVPLDRPHPAFRRVETELILRDGQWSSECTCRRTKCMHGYAAMLAVLAQQQSRNGAPPNGRKRRPGAEAAAKKSSVDALEAAYAAKVGRALRSAEKRVVHQFLRFQDKLRRGVAVYFSDLEGLLDLYWHVPDCSPLRAKAHLDSAAFFQEFALHAMLHGGRLPSVLAPLLDQEGIARAMAEKKRLEEIDRWRRTLAHLPRRLAPETAPSVDLAVMITLTQVQLVVQAMPDAPFKRLSASALQQLFGRVAEGSQAVQPDALAIFNAVTGLMGQYVTGSFAMGESVARALLSLLFRNPSVQSRLLTAEGKPFQRIEKPLQWCLTEVDGGDYELFLADERGHAMPRDMVTLIGNPYLYLTADKCYEGPPKPKELTIASQRIPAPALETNDGLGLIAALKLPIPARIEARIRKVRLEARIRCRVRHSAYSPNEHCFLEVFTHCDEIGLRECYGHNGWFTVSNAQEEKGLYIFDRPGLELVPAVLEDLGATWDVYEKQWRVRLTKNFPERFISWYQQVPKHFKLELDPELASLVRDPVKARVMLECEEVNVDWFDLRTTVSVEDTTLTAQEIELLLNANGKPVKLPGKGWRRLEYELTDEEDQSLARLGISPTDLSGEPQRFHALQLADRAAEKLLAQEQYQRIRERASEIKTRVTPPIPGAVTAELRPYQTEGFHFLAYLAENNFGGILADDMGLGKTLQTLTWLAWLRERQEAMKPSLVVCPKSVMDNWHSEAAKFTPQLKVQIWRGVDEGAFAAAAAETDLLVVNYAQLRALGPSSGSIHWHVVILDEAQAIKNPTSQTAQAARALRADHRLALSGTPIENRLLDLWSLMAFAMPGILGNRTEFKRRFDQQNDPFARRRLSARVRPFLLRRTKNQVAADLPDRIEEDILCEMEGVQKTLYRAEFKRAQQLLLKVQTQAELNEFRFHFLSSLLRLRQICCHPALVDADRKNEESAKLSALTDLLEPLMEEGYKVLVFSQFVEMLSLIRDRVSEQGWTHFYLDGSSENRGELVDEFQRHEGAAVFLISLKAGGFGLNLTAASYVVLYDPWWNPAVEAQAIDRTHRIGQTQKVIAYRLLTKESIEQKIRHLQRQKSSLAENVLGDESFGASLTVEDLRFLFEGEPE